MTTDSRRLSLMLSLKERPSGELRLRITRTLPGCGTARMELHRKPGTGGARNGPAQKPAFSQLTMLSVTKDPCSTAAGVFGSMRAGRGGEFWQAEAPKINSRTTWRARDRWASVIPVRASTRAIRAGPLTGETASVGRRRRGIEDQKAVGGGIP